MAINFANDVDIIGNLTVKDGSGNLDLENNQAVRVRVENLSVEPSTAPEGRIIYNTTKGPTDNKGRLGFKFQNGWIYPDMERSVYDTNNNGKVDIAENAELLNGQTSAYYLNRSNHTGTQAASTIYDFDNAVMRYLRTAFSNSNSISWDTSGETIKAYVACDPAGNIEVTNNGIDLKARFANVQDFYRVRVNTYGLVVEGSQILQAADISDFPQAVNNVVNSKFENSNTVQFAVNTTTQKVKANAILSPSSGLIETAQGIDLTNRFGSSQTFAKVTVNQKGIVTDGQARINTSDINNFEDDVKNAAKTIPLNQFAAPTGSINLNNQKIIGLGSPINSTDAATKEYVDMMATGLKVKTACRVATTGNVNLAAVTQIDGVTLLNGNRVLVKDQTTTSQNGIYVFESGVGLYRADDADAWDELVGAYVFITEGSTNAGGSYWCSVQPGGTLGVTSVQWVLFSEQRVYNFNNPLTLSGSTVSLNYNTNTLDLDGSNALNAKLDASKGLTSSTSGIRINEEANHFTYNSGKLNLKLKTNGGLSADTNGVFVSTNTDTFTTSGNIIDLAPSYKNKKYAIEITVGTGAYTHLIAHNLNSTNVMVQVFKKGTRNSQIIYQSVIPDIEITDANTVTITFKQNTLLNGDYKVVIM